VSLAGVVVGRAENENENENEGKSESDDEDAMSAVSAEELALLSCMIQLQVQDP